VLKDKKEVDALVVVLVVIGSRFFANIEDVLIGG
jgi:hypothetical protein